ncbi:sensor histidine kinase [Desulfovibrio psychrotolerans]|uniref:histidine kinase n=1 Tax=Desulfovibrio psychrotolerans TaxID=415242 RepID=A0A7J0BT33_9BACT|nr:HAMP domain-containing sensor histidine kinase [Desulfovibrio psychrotolerans]GFM36876.1 hypothetical protein DSM19430T_15600 [Desulfovibrio psychrotolerans]
MTLTQHSHDSFRWLAARVILLSATPVGIVALTVGSLLFSAYGRDAQTPFGTLAQSVVSCVSTLPEAMERAKTTFPGAAVLYVDNGAVVLTEGGLPAPPATERALELAATLASAPDAGAQGTSGAPMLALHTANPPLPGSDAMAAVALNSLSSTTGALVIIMPLTSLFPQMQFAWGVTAIIGCVTIILLLYNSLVFSGFVQQRLSSEELRRRALERKMIEANRLSSLGTLAAGIAHEINNPLSIMTEEAGWIEDIIEDDLPRQELVGKVRTSAGVIRMQGARCREITHNLLSLSRQGVTSAGAVDINHMAEEVASLSRHRCLRQGVSLVLELQPDLPAAHAAQAHVQQILLNLLGNALDAMQEQQAGTLTVRSWAHKDAVFVSVRDTGPGMSESVRARIFEPFFTTKPSGKGTGLGLAICYGLARRNNGALSVFSREGEGATFVLALPRLKVDETALHEDNLDTMVPDSPEPKPRTEGGKA